MYGFQTESDKRFSGLHRGERFLKCVSPPRHMTEAVVVFGETEDEFKAEDRGGREGGREGCRRMWVKSC